MLTQERLKELLDYDTETGVFTWRVHMSRKVRVGDQAGCIKVSKAGKRYVQIRVNGRTYRAHRLAFVWMEGSAPENDTDHEDGDGTNNRWSNLKRVNRLQNAKNVRRRSDNTSGTTGVYWSAGMKKWHSGIGVEDKRLHLGWFSTKEDAIAVRRAAELEHGFHPNHGSDRPL